MLKARADAVFRTGLSGVQARTSTVKVKRGDKTRGPRRGTDFAQRGQNEESFDTKESPRSGRRTGGNKQFIQGTGSRSGKGGGTGKLYNYRERGKGGRTGRDKDKGGSKSK